MRRSLSFVAASLVLLSAAGMARAPAVGTDRLTDRDLKALVERIDDGRDHFEDALDSRLKHRVVPGSFGEMDVKAYLDHFKDSVDRLKARLKPGDPASTEVGTVLRQGSVIDAFFRRLSPSPRGASEWNRLAADLKAVAIAYGADFPLADNASVSRMDDGQVAAAADEVALTAERLGKSLDDELKNDFRVDKDARQSIVGEADRLSNAAKILRDRVKESEPSSGELDRLLAQASRVQAVVKEYEVPASKGILAGVVAPLQALAGAYGVRWPGAR